MHALSSVAGLRRIKPIPIIEAHLANVTVCGNDHSIESHPSKRPWWQGAFEKLKSKK
jgi:hypothetical protein